MTNKKNRLVCICNGVTETDILRILKKGARDVGDVRKFTLASTVCGRCRSEIQTIVDQYLSTIKPDLQQNINF